MKTPTLRLLTFAVAGLSAAGIQTVHAEDFNIGYQKGSATLILLKNQGTLEQKLKPLGVTVKWTEFPGGPQLLEALNVGSISFGSTGEAPPIFAQAAGADLVYVGYEAPAPKAEAIVVQQDSPLKKLSDLKGKKVALNKGSNVHYLLVKALEKAGLRYSDIQPVFLPPADARAAFAQHSVDAWAIWDPFLASAEKQLGARTLADGQGVVSNRQFYLAARPYAQSQPKVISTLLQELGKTAQWAKKEPKQAATILSQKIGVEQDIVSRSLARTSYGVFPITPEVAADQQKIADTFQGLGLIPKSIRVSDVLLASH
jgi:sulfonate transport system substrate-binding protein